jgi:hypothetical protein
VTRLFDRFPRSAAALVYALVTAVTFRAVLAGQWLINPMSDQRTGYAFREFAAAHYKATGEIPQWYGYLFGGMPYAANTAHGDTFFPTFWLRVLFDVDTGMSLGFVLFTWLAGFSTFLFARGLGLSAGPSLLAGGAYMLSGQVISLVSPGHDGKLFVSALLPLTMLALWRAVRADDWRWYVLFGGAVGASLLTPHVQMTYYLLMAAGFWWAYLQFLHRPSAPGAWPKSAALFAGGIAVGFAVAAVQLIPFFDYIPLSPRGAGGSSTGYEFATSYSLPLGELFDVIWPSFSGARETYWGSNPLRLHSSYLGAAALVLATLAFRREGSRRLGWFFVFLGVYGTLFALGGNTPFYRIPYTVLPGIAKTRAPDMIFFLVSLATAVLAGFGTQWLAERDADSATVRTPKATAMFVWIGVFVVGALLALSGGFRGLMEGMALPERAGQIDVNYGAFTTDAIRTAVVGIAAAVLALLAMRGRMTGRAAALALSGVVVLDGFSAAQPFVLSSPPARDVFPADSVVQVLKRDSSLFRILPVPGTTYSDNYFMTHRLRSSFGYNGQELQRYDDLMGGKNQWQNLGNPNVWKVSGVKYILTPQPIAEAQLALVAGPVTSYEGQPTYIYRFAGALPYAFLVPEAVKVPDAQVLPTLLDPRFDPRTILLVPQDAAAGQAAVAAVPAPIDVAVQATEPAAGHLRLALATPAPKAAYVFVAENWYPSWTATVDGKAAPVLRAQHSMMAVPVPAGATNVDLRFVAAEYPMAKAISLGAIVAVLVVAGLAVVANRRRDGMENAAA